MGRVKAKKTGGRAGLAKRVLAWLLMTAFALVLIAALWAGIYRFAGAPGTFLMAQRALEGETVRYDWTPIGKISPHLVRAVIGAEDSRFCQHEGFDLAAIEKALEEAEAGGRLRGASTISQQTAKNAFLWNGRSWVRKGLEAGYTVLIEALWPKRRIMEMYLNIAEWGDGIFGAEAAAQARFGKPAADLTAYEAALLAAVLPNPNEWRVDPPGPYVSRRAGTLQARARTVAAQGLAGCVGAGA